MKKIVLTLIVAGVIATFGCSSNDGSSKIQTVTKDSTTEIRSADTTVVQTQIARTVTSEKESQATAELCTCVNSLLNDMSPQVRKIIVKAAQSSTPMQTLATELQGVKGTAEQERLFREIEKFENDLQLQRCSESIKQKYNLDENDKASTEKILKAASENKDCEVMYALMKIGLEQEKSVRALQK